MTAQAALRVRKPAAPAADTMRDAKPEQGSIQGRMVTKVEKPQELDVAEECCSVLASTASACCWICHACLDILSD